MFEVNPYYNIEIDRKTVSSVTKNSCINTGSDTFSWQSYCADNEIYYPSNKFFLEDGKLLLSNHAGEYQHIVSSYAPNYMYTPTREEPYTLCVKLQNNHYESGKPWMSCCIGVRVKEVQPRSYSISNTWGSPFLAVNGSNTVALYTGRTTNWPKPSAEIKLPVSFEQPQTIYITDYGDRIEFAVLIEQSKRLFCTIEIFESEYCVKDSQENILCYAQHHFDAVNSGYFVICNHFGLPIIHSVSIVKESAKDSTHTVCFSDSFSSRYNYDIYHIIQFASEQKDIVVNGRQLVVNKGSFLLLSPYDLYDDFRNVAVSLDIKFNRAYLLKYFHGRLVDEALCAFSKQIINLAESDFVHVTNVKRYIKHNDSANDMAYLFICELLLILSHYKSSSFLAMNKEHELISAIVEFIEENTMSINSIEDIAKTFYISKYYLCHIFKKSMGTTVIKYINDVKIRKSCEMLRRNPSSSLTKVAIMCGFGTVQYFSAVFTKKMGISPRKYKEKCLSETAKKQIQNQQSEL